MQVKIDTKEKFTVITPQETVLNDSFTEDFEHEVKSYLDNPIKNVVVNLREVQQVSELMAKSLVNLQLHFYEKNASFVICEMQASSKQVFDQLELWDGLNTTPTESEAWDIVQMDEIERELLSGE